LCIFTSNNKTSSNSSPEGNSAWITCPTDTYGSNLYITSNTLGRVEIIEVMAFSQYNVLPNGWIYDNSSSSLTSTEGVSNSSFSNMLKTDLKISTGGPDSCYTSISSVNPYILLKFPAAIEIKAILPLVQINSESTESSDFS
jgi:hypothetical protein